MSRAKNEKTKKSCQSLAVSGASRRSSVLGRCTAYGVRCTRNPLSVLGSQWSVGVRTLWLDVGNPGIGEESPRSFTLPWRVQDDKSQRLCACHYPAFVGGRGEARRSQMVGGRAGRRRRVHLVVRGFGVSPRVPLDPLFQGDDAPEPVATTRGVIPDPDRESRNGRRTWVHLLSTADPSSPFAGARVSSRMTQK
jgi:hypothetical protein